MKLWLISCSIECGKVNRQRRMKAWNTAHPERIEAFKRRFNERMAA